MVYFIFFYNYTSKSSNVTFQLSNSNNHWFQLAILFLNCERIEECMIDFTTMLFSFCFFCDQFFMHSKIAQICNFSKDRWLAGDDTLLAFFDDFVYFMSFSKNEKVRISKSISNYLKFFLTIGMGKTNLQQFLYYNFKYKI